MIRLPTAALAALRNRLADRGARASLLPITGGEDADLDAAILDEFGPLCDAMYVMMAADGDLGAAERDVLRGALRELDDRVRSRHVEALVAASASALHALGRDALVASIGAALADDATRAEAAVLLAAAVAYADGEIAGAEDAAMAALMAALKVDPARMRTLMTALERMDAVLARDAKADAADVVIHAALHLRTPEDFERLAAKTDRPDVTLVLRLVGAYVHALDELLDAQSTPASIPAAAAAALSKLGAALPAHRTPRLDQLRASVVGVAAALSTITSCDARAAMVEETDGSCPVRDLEQSLAALSELCAKALSRCGLERRAAWSPSDLATAIVDASSGAPERLARLDAHVAALVEGVAPTLPPAIVFAVASALSGLSRLPAQAAEHAGPRAPSRLPEWLPESGKLGGFRLLSSLGSGGAGSVFVAVRADDVDPAAEQYALKVPQYDAVAAQSVSESEYLSVFKREAGALLAVPEHPNLAGFVTFDARSRPKPMLVMELVEGTDCHELLKRRGFDTRTALDVLDGVLAGLGAMHEAGVGHLDVKPSNVVLRTDGTAVLVDFGLAGRRLRVGCATPAYASPEVWGVVDDGATPFSADVYSFGCLAFEMLGGRPLFEAPSAVAAFTLHSQHDGAPPPVRAWLDAPQLSAVAGWLSRCLRRAPRDRPTVDAVRAELGSLRATVAARPWPIDRRSDAT